MAERSSVTMRVSIIAAGALALSAGAAEPLLSDPAVIALKQRDCKRAVQAVNTETRSDNAVGFFVAGRILDEGICVNKDPEGATAFFARGADAGNAAAALGYAMKIGLGEGGPQDYRRAGDLCHGAGVDSRGRLSFYSLGYACTVGGLAGRLLRESLPLGAFHTPTPPARIEFSPASGEFRILSVPDSLRAEAATGSFVGARLVEPRRAIEKAWREALASVPKPNAADLGGEVIELPLDLDLTLEAPRGQEGQGLERIDLMQTDFHPTTPK
jgi:TPR repeat protein